MIKAIKNFISQFLMFGSLIFLWVGLNDEAIRTDIFFVSIIFILLAIFFKEYK